MSKEERESTSILSIPDSQPDDLDRKVRSLFPGVAVRKDLVRRMRSAYSVPTFVIEFLLGRYCSDPDDGVVREGMEYVRGTLSDKYAKPDERELIKSRIEQQRRYELIEKVAVRLVEEDNQYWAELKNIDVNYVRIDSSEIRKHERLLTGGLWAEVEIEYDDSFQFKGKTRPFIIRELRPIQVSNLELGQFLENRARFSTEEWLNFLIRSLGFKEDHPYFTPRRKMLYVARLIPLVEKNFNLVELGPRGTGKSFVYQQVSPYSHLISGGQTTAAQMFVNLSSGQKGLVALWDAVAFDEMPRAGFEDKKVIDICKNYMEDGQFSRGREMIAAEGSVVFVGNLDGDIETILRTSHLFYPMPKQMDLAFFDRIHCYLPGWEFEKTRDEYYTSHLGFVSDFLAEVLTKLRKDSYTHRPEELFRFGSHLSGRDQKAVRKTVSGLIKLLNPHGDVSKEELTNYIEFAMEMRRRVKEQLKKMGGMEYWDVNFSFIERETAQESFVQLPESGGGQIIPTETMSPGTVYSIGLDAEDQKIALFLIQTQANKGSGRIIPLGNLSARMKEAIKVADAYLKANISDFGIEKDLKSYDFSIQALNLSQAKEGTETAVAFYVSMLSALLEKPVKEQTVVLGEMSVGGILMRVSNLVERMQLALDSGAKRILLPSENKRDLPDVPDTLLNKIQPVFYMDPTNAAIRAMGLE